MSIKDKIMLSYLTVAVIIGYLGGFAFYHDIDTAETIASHEAVNIAKTFSLFLVGGHSRFVSEDTVAGRRELQTHVDQFKAVQNRNIAIVDTNRRVIAGASHAEVGALFAHDPYGEVEQTLKDGQVRFFTERNEASPEGTKLLVYPLELRTGDRAGALVLEYTPLYREIMNTTKTAALKFLLLYIGGVLLSLGVGYLLSRHISTPLLAIKDAALMVAQGDLDVNVKLRASDELGLLAHSFNRMTESLKQSRDQLMQSHEKLKTESVMRKMSEKALLVNEQKLWTMFEFATDALFILDLKGNFVDANRTAYERLGYTKEELLSLHISNIDSPEFADQVPARLEQLSARGAAVFEAVHVRKDGSTMPVEINARIMELGEKQVLFSVVRNITERKRAETQMKEMNSRLATLVQSIPDMVVFKDPEGRHLIVNRAVEEVLGRGSDEIIGKTVAELLPPGPAEACRLSDEKAMAKNAVTNVEEQLNGPDGKTRDFAFVKAPIFDTQNNCLGLVTIGRDITESKWVEAELARHSERLMDLVDERTRELMESNEKLRKEIAERERMENELINARKLESLGTLAGGIAHDFNNLLTSILGNISLALLDLDQKHPLHRQLTNAERASLRAQDLTQQLLTFSKGGAPIRKTLSIGDIIRESVGFAMRGSRVRCDISLARGLRLVDADEGQMSQVFHNLLINADQAMPSGGVTIVRAENVDLPGGETTLLPPGKYVRISVQDNGIGIPKEHLEKIFDPFFTTKQRGSGLGLATTYSIIKKHNGGISVDSSPGAGTTVTIFLPASSSAPATGNVQSATLRSASGRVLIMDDDESVRQITGDALSMLGYAVDFAEDGALAIELYQKAMSSGRPFDVVIMDLTIPGGMGGQEAITRLLKIDPEVKALVSSGYSNDPVMAEYRTHGFAGVVSKPYRIKELSETVYRLISKNGEEGHEGT